MDKRKLDTRLADLLRKDQGEALVYVIVIQTRCQLNKDTNFFLPIIRKMNFQHILDIEDENISTWIGTLSGSNILKLTNEDWVVFIHLPAERKLIKPNKPKKADEKKEK